MAYANSAAELAQMNGGKFGPSGDPAKATTFAGWGNALGFTDKQGGRDFYDYMADPSVSKNTDWQENLARMAPDVRSAISAGGATAASLQGLQNAANFGSSTGGPTTPPPAPAPTPAVPPPPPPLTVPSPLSRPATAAPPVPVGGSVAAPPSPVTPATATPLPQQATPAPTSTYRTKSSLAGLRRASRPR